MNRRSVLRALPGTCAAVVAAKVVIAAGSPGKIKPDPTCALLILKLPEGQ